MCHRAGLQTPRGLKFFVLEFTLQISSSGCWFLCFNIFGNKPLICHVADRVLVLRPAVRPEPLRWDSRVQDTGPPETSQPHVISISESCPRDLHLNAKTAPPNGQQAPQLDTLCQTTSKTGTKPHPLAERLPKIIVSSQDTPKHTTGRSPAHQKDKIQPHPPQHRYQSPPPGSLQNALNQTYPLGADTKNNGNYEPAACKKETPNTVS